MVGADLKRANVSGANLSGANLSEANLSGAKLRNTILDGAILCKTKTPWGIDNSNCQSCEIFKKFDLPHVPERCKDK